MLIFIPSMQAPGSMTISCRACWVAEVVRLSRYASPPCSRENPGRRKNESSSERLT